MSILGTNPSTVEQAIAPFKKVVANLKAVRATQKKKAVASQLKINAARQQLESTERTQTAIINSATSEEIAATRLLEKLEALLSPDVPAVDEMKPSDKMSAGHTKDKA